MDEQAVHRALLRPEAYPGGEGPVGFTETHVSRLYFTPRHVYKLKKPVDFGFLNFTTLDRRRFYCEEEVRLNRRFAPGTYLGVVEIRRTPAGIGVGSEGELVDYAVWMQRLPAERMLDRRIAANDPDLPQQMQRLGERLAELHAESPVCREAGGQPNLDVVRTNWRENFSQIAPYAGQTLSPGGMALLSAWVERHLAQEAPLLRRREAEGQVRDGHGDLHAEHICLTEPLQIYDCIEFNRRFRVADVAADIAFLLMDLEFRGRRDLAETLLAAWSAGRRDASQLALLLPFYKVYRAFVRGKVESFLAGEETAEASTRQQAAQRARGYFNLALGYLCPPVLVLTCGLMGTGKSTVAAPLAQALGAELLRSDLLRKELAGEAAAGGKDTPFGAGIYTPEFTARTYDRLLADSLPLLQAGRSVVADASFTRRAERDRFRQAAAGVGIPALIVLTECPRPVALARLDARREAGGDPSDGRRELFDPQAAAFEPVAAAEGAIRVDTTAEVDYTVQTLLAEIIERTGICR